MTKLNFGQKLMLLRKNRKLTQADLSKALSIGVNNIARYETGRFPSAEILLKLADFFNVSLDYLLKEDSVNIQDKDLAIILEKVDLLEPSDKAVIKGLISGAVDSYLRSKKN